MLHAMRSTRAVPSANSHCRDLERHDSQVARGNARVKVRHLRKKHVDELSRRSGHVLDNI